MMTLVLFPNSPHESAAREGTEDRIARLADAAYQAALRQGLTGSFVDAELGIWTAIRRAVEVEQAIDDDFVFDSRAPQRFPARFAEVG
jgi:hypothetical protein